MIRIDTQKCKRDSICIAECPFDLLYENEDGYPEIRRAAKRMCIRCGHCLAICPHGALTFEETAPEDCAPVLDEHSLSPAQVEQFFKSRRSVRLFKKQPLERAELETLFDLARYAPSAKNGQAVDWIVFNGRERVHQLTTMLMDWMREHKVMMGAVKAWDRDGTDHILHAAPCIALAHVPQKGLDPQTDCAVACAHLELAAHAKGLGATWAGFLMTACEMSQQVREFIGVPEGHAVYGALMLGRPKFRYHRVPTRKPAQVEWKE